MAQNPRVREILQNDWTVFSKNISVLKQVRNSFLKCVQFSTADGIVLLQNPRSLCCESSIGVCFVTSGTYTNIGSPRWYRPSSRTICIAPCFWCRALFCPGPHSKLRPFYVTKYVGWNSITSYGLCFVQIPKGLLWNITFFFVEECLRCSNVPFTLEDMYWHIPDHWALKIFTNVEGPSLWGACTLAGLSMNFTLLTGLVSEI